ncbi:hypothetical protein [Shewanella sp. WE21]|jgi:hypothetical protein|uniref:hypothetical protein n=1 Tax=Shewanella sp. WE21 TaxID=2029986 RepID=UPI00131A104B|nr:hypothetical protein [Shewanella sp. WE21]
MKFLPDEWMIIKRVIIYIVTAYSFTASSNERPLKRESILRVEHPSAIQYTSALIQSGTSNTLVYESWSGYKMEKAWLRYTSLNFDHGVLDKGSSVNILPESPSNIVSSVSLVNFNGEDWLYYLEARSFKSEADVFRAKLRNGVLVEIEPVSLKDAIAPSSNIKFHRVSRNSVAIVYTAKKCCSLYFALSNDGVKFDTPSAIDSSGFMPYLSSFSGGDIVYFFQKSFRTSQTQPSGKPVYITKTHFRISSNLGNTWTEAIPINLTDATVHDAKAIIRPDGNIDIYYVYPIQENSGLSLWRRCLNPNGQLGVEELVVESSFGNIAKPTTHRLNTGELLITFVEQGKAVLEGDHNLHAAIISRDASCDLGTAGLIQ